jgi:hypothetical protein
MPHDEKVHQLSGGASAVWAEVEIPRTRGELLGTLAATYEVDAREVAREVADCLEALSALGLIEELSSAHE